MTAYDEIAEAEADDECRAWLTKILGAKEEIIAFVSSRRSGCSMGEFNGYMRGSFNLCISVRFNDDGPNSIIRFPKPGHTLTARRDEKVKREVQILQYLRENTNLPVPFVNSWGLTDESPSNLGPFIIMDYIDGTALTTLLRKPAQSEEDNVILRDDIDDSKLDYVYEQLAEFMIELSRPDFDAIGAITKTSDHQWLATGSPFTYNMNEMAVTVAHYPVETFPTTPFKTTRDYLEYQSNENLTHLRVQRNLASGREDAKRRYIARHQFRKLIPKYCMSNNGPFKLFCDDLQPSNMLADPVTFKIHSIIDWEFTHAMPAQFSSDPPWWLLLKGPDMWLEHYSMEEFVARYTPRLQQFLRAMQRVEKRSPRIGPKLSTQMQESWDSGRFWFDYGIRKSMDVDDIYWGALHQEEDDVLDEEQQKMMEEFVEAKMKDLKAYDIECKERGL